MEYSIPRLIGIAQENRIFWRPKTIALTAFACCSAQIKKGKIIALVKILVRYMLLLSSPCIEVLGDIDRVEPLKVDHLEEYKKEQNKKHEDNDKKHTREYIIENFEKLVCYYLDKNVTESGDKNIMNHPEFVMKKVNELNDRTFISDKEIPVYYRYFTTVVYVCIAYIKGPTKEFENSDKVKSFFKGYIK